MTVSSCHPKVTSKAIPYSLALRIIRICTKRDQRDLRLKDLKELLLAREYPENLTDRAIAKAVKIPRKVALLKVRKNVQFLSLNMTLGCHPSKIFKLNIGGQ